MSAARLRGEARLTAARLAAEALDAERSRAEAAAHDARLAELHSRHRAALAALEGVSDARVDALATWAVRQAVGHPGGPS